MPEQLGQSSQVTAVLCIKLQLLLPLLGGKEGLKWLFPALVFRRLNQLQLSVMLPLHKASSV